MTVGSTTKLNVKQFNEYLEKVKEFARGYGFKLGEEEI
jgi:alpha-D-ribose 1-methylphosphonate 5-triphosphate synthase subunit PhnI